MDRKAFYDTLRADNRVFGSSLTSSEVAGMEANLDEGQRRGVSLEHLSYINATDYHETGGRMQPIAENLNYSVSGLLRTFGRHRISEADARRLGRTRDRPADQIGIANIIYGGAWGRKNLGNTKAGDGWLMRGRGKPQITGRANYRKFGIEDDPDAALDLRKSVQIMFDGMLLGKFTGRKLSDFGTYEGMRQTVNGNDKADAIANYARAFEAALRKARYDPSDTLPAPPPPLPIPAPVREVVEDAAADDRMSTTEIVAVGTGATGVVTAVNETVEAVNDTTATLMSTGPWVLLGLVTAGFGFYIWRERRRKRNVARQAKAAMQ